MSKNDNLQKNQTKNRERRIKTSRSAKAKKNIATASILQLVKISLSFINRIIFVRIMGASYLGINGLFSNILSILSLADMGMYTVMMYSLYEPLAKKDNKKIAALVRTFNKIYVTIAVIVGAVGLAITPLLKYIVNLPQNIEGVYLFYLLMLANVVIGYLFVYKTTLLQADQKSYVLDRVDIISHIALFILQVLVLIVSKNYVLYLCSSVIITAIGNLAKSFAVKKHYNDVLDKRAILNKSESKKLVTNIKSMFLYKIGSVIQSNTDNILISVFVGTLVVGLYSNYAMVILAVTGFVSIIFNTLKASVGNYVVEKSRKEQEKMFFNFEDYSYCIVGFCSICFFSLLPDFIKLCFGEEYLLDSITLIFIVLNFYTSNIRQNIWVYRETTGLFAKVKHTTLVTSAFNLVLSLIGGKLFGITGIIAATVIARMLYNWWKEPSVLFTDYFNSGPKRYLLTYIARVAYICLIMVIVAKASNIINLGNEVLQFGVRCIFTAVCSAAAIYLPISKNESIALIKKKYLHRR